MLLSWHKVFRNSHHNGTKSILQVTVAVSSLLLCCVQCSACAAASTVAGWRCTSTSSSPSPSITPPGSSGTSLSSSTSGRLSWPHQMDIVYYRLFTQPRLKKMLILWSKLVCCSVWSSNVAWCRALHVLVIYCTLSTYFWMLCEGAYLQLLLVNTFQVLKSRVEWFCTFFDFWKSSHFWWSGSF